MLSLLNLSCELFTTRDPEEPDTPRSNYQVANYSGNFIAKSDYAFQDKKARKLYVLFC